MKTLAISEPGTVVAVQGEELVLRRGGADGPRVRLQEVEDVMAFGAVDFTSGAVSALLARGIGVELLTAGGRFRGRIAGRGTRDASTRLAQYARAHDAEFRLRAARAVARGKILNQRALLLQAQRELMNEEVAGAAARMRLAAENAGRAAGLEELRGLEGSAGAAYFGVFGRLLRDPRFTFEGRTRRPPRDPVNACLSFGYAVLGTIVEGAVAAAGLEPLVGFFHEIDHGRPSLALDLLEEWRPAVVDAVTLRLINRRQLGPGDFRSPDAEERAEEALFGEAPAGGNGAGAVYLGPTGRKVFLAGLFARLREEAFYPPLEGTFSYRQMITEQARRMARAVRGEGEYEAFAWR
jgi:CRISPR-associated protein Cas1